MTLFEIDEEIMNCVKLTGSDDYVNVETGEIIDVEALKSLEMERDRKLRNIGCWVLNLQAEEAALAEQIKKFMLRKQQAHNKAESLKNYVSAFLAGRPWKCDECEYKFRKTESVKFDGNIEDVPEEFLRLKAPELDKAAAKKALKAGIEIPGASLEVGQSISVR